jgi:hypothetical protein
MGPLITNCWEHEDYPKIADDAVVRVTQSAVPCTYQLIQITPPELNRFHVFVLHTSFIRALPVLEKAHILKRIRIVSFTDPRSGAYR